MELVKNNGRRVKAIALYLILFVAIELVRSYLVNIDSLVESILLVIAAAGAVYLISQLLSNNSSSLEELASAVLEGKSDIASDSLLSDNQGTVAKAFGLLLNRLNSGLKSNEVLLSTMKKAAGEQDVEKTLKIVLEGAKAITSARYAALGIFDQNRKVEKFIQIGMEQSSITAIGHYPEGKGLLGYIHETKTLLRVDDMKKHPRSVGFPAGHPAMQSLIAVPLLHGEKSLGNLYVADKNTADKAFSADDEQAMAVFAQIAAYVISEKYSSREIHDTKKYLEEEVSRLVAVLDSLAKGDLTVEVSVDNKNNDITRLKTQLVQMIHNLKHLLGQVKEAVEATASASTQISSSTEEMSSGAQEQTVQASEVAGAVEEMTKTILETSKNTALAAETARDAGDRAKEGGTVIVETIAGMNRIAEVVLKSAKTVETLGQSSNQIGEIVQVIDDIADQTNLLALNAAIEAARAGEQGRGFAVVADEVRKLAERTTKATKEIATMIKQIQQDTEDAVNSMTEGTREVESGKELANKAGKALNQIIDATNKVSDIIAQVAVAADQQSRASDDISKNIEAITTVTQETSAGIGQIAQATEDLSQLTNRLQDLVTRFKLGDSRAAHSQLSVRSNGLIV